MYTHFGPSKIQIYLTQINSLLLHYKLEFISGIVIIYDNCTKHINTPCELMQSLGSSDNKNL